MVQIRVLIPFLSFFSKVFFWFAFLVNANANDYDANDMFKYLIISLQKWGVTYLPLEVAQCHGGLVDRLF